MLLTSDTALITAIFNAIKDKIEPDYSDMTCAKYYLNGQLIAQESLQDGKPCWVDGEGNVLAVFDGWIE